MARVRKEAATLVPTKATARNFDDDDDKKGV
jgi:hypothetical protein